MKGFSISPSQRIQALPPYLFAAIDELKQQAIARGVDIVNLGIGDPDLPTPEPIIDRLQQAATNPQNHQYPSYDGLLAFRHEIATWYQRRFGVTLDPQKEILTLIGSKEGIGHMPLAIVDPGDVVLVPSPGYPVYPVATQFAGGEVYVMPLTKKHGFLPDLEAIPPDVRRRAKMMFLNYPNNPTAGAADRSFFEHVVRFAHEHQIAVCHDAAYSEIYFDGHRPMSFLEAEGAKDIGLEFHSLSKTFNMTGWRIGFAVGNSHLVSALGKIKSNLDSGVFQAVQEAGMAALQAESRLTDPIRAVYQERRDVLVSGLQKLGLEVAAPSATFYVWAGVPTGYTSAKFTAHLLEKAGIVTTPGNGFGEPGEGFVRFALTTSTDRLTEALARMNHIRF